MAPALRPERADRRAPTELAHPDTFLLRLVQHLGDSFDADNNFAWTHHSYLDVEDERKRRGGERQVLKTTNSVDWVVRLLRKRTPSGRRRGARKQARLDRLARRERQHCRARDHGGGCRRSNVPSDAAQAQRLQSAWSRMRGSRLGSGVALFTTFLSWQDEGVQNTGFLARRQDIDTRAADDPPADFGPYRVAELYGAWKTRSEG